MTQVLEVTADHVNLRSAPALDPHNIVDVLRRGQRVDGLEPAASEWWRVQAESSTGRHSGYVASRYLQTVAVGVSTPQSWSPPGLAPGVASRLGVHILGVKDARRDSMQARHAALTDTSAVPLRDSQVSDSAKVTKLRAIVEFLAVERSARYQPAPPHTYCNVYAYDYCYLAGAYLPRVWWNGRALASALQGLAPPPVWGRTVDEVTANGLCDWLAQWGAEFGWRAASDVDELQVIVDRGCVGLICGQRVNLDQPGHIVAVVPESDQQRAIRANAKISVPLQSQAGARNYEYFADPWWQRLASRFRSRGFWYHA